MLRKIWRRAAALALPLTLAICLPPLAVIALNLRAQSTAAASTTAPSAHTTVRTPLKPVSKEPLGSANQSKQRENASAQPLQTAIYPGNHAGSSSR